MGDYQFKALKPKSLLQAMNEMPGCVLTFEQYQKPSLWTHMDKELEGFILFTLNYKQQKTMLNASGRMNYGMTSRTCFSGQE